METEPPATGSAKRATTASASRSPKSPRPKAATGEAPARSSGSHALVIVESPKKARSINKFLGSGTWSRPAWATSATCPSASSASTWSNGYTPSYEIIPAKKDTVGELKREAARADMVYLATDPDREGEAIAWHLQQALDLPDDRVRRVTFHEITERAVKEAFSHVGPINMDMVNAQQARRFLDRFVGYQLSPLLWSKVARNLSAGRVQSVAVRLIADREREIQAFVSEEYWKITATVSPAGATAEADRFEAAWPSTTAPSSRPRTRPTPTRSATPWPSAAYVVSRGRGGREARQGRSSVQDQHAPAAGGDPPAVRRQADDEDRPGAVRRDRRRRHRPVGLITYMRTDSLRVSDEAMQGRPRPDQDRVRRALPARQADPLRRRQDWRRRPTRPSGPPT